MKNKKLTKLAIVATSAMLLAGCQEDAALKEYQRQALQTKLEQMPAAEADAYIRAKMEDVTSHAYSLTKSTIRKNGMQLVGSYTGKENFVERPLLDIWAENDTNGSFIDEYVDFASRYREIEPLAKRQAEAEFLQGQTKADRKKAKLQAEIEKRQKQIDAIDQGLSQ